MSKNEVALFRFRFRPGALREIARRHALSLDTQLAAAIGVSGEQLLLLDKGAPVTPRLILKVNELTGVNEKDCHWFEPIPEGNAQAA